jgi:AcrR family transcriptional regulator
MPRRTAKSVAERAPPAAIGPDDGRRRRADASRAKIVEAMLEFAREGVFEPSADLVAVRAGVGRRTVFRLFTDMDSLYSEMHVAILRRVEPIFSQPIEGDDWRARLDRLVERRTRFFEEIMPFKIAADAIRHRSEFLQRDHQTLTQMLRELVLFILPKEINDDPVKREALDMALSVEAWRRLRCEQRLSPKASLRVLKYTTAAILDRRE